MKMPYVVAAAAICAAVLAASAEVALVFATPAQPLAFGTVQWFDEVGVTVDSVQRAALMGSGARAVRAKGEFYIVHARILAPFGFRPAWHDSDVEVRTFAGSGATLPAMHFGVDEPAQAILDRETGRPGPDHLVRGAQQREDLVFDLPRNVEQPALVFLPANDPAAMLDIIFLRFWRPHRFNLRYD